MGKTHQIFYHFTSRENAKKIMASGLKPQIGQHAAAVKEPNICCYLTDYHSIDAWNLTLNEDMLLYLRIPNEFAEKHIKKWPIAYGKYCPYHEYLCDETIPAEYIKKTVRIPEPSTETIRDMCKDVIIDLSHQVVNNIRRKDKISQFEYPAEPEDKKRIEDAIQFYNNHLSHLLDRLDMTLVPADELSEILKDIGENGDYTLCDTYGDQTERLWEMLYAKNENPNNNQSDDWVTSRIRLKAAIEHNIPKSVLYTHTGRYENPYRK